MLAAIIHAAFAVVVSLMSLLASMGLNGVGDVYQMALSTTFNTYSLPPPPHPVFDSGPPFGSHSPALLSGLVDLSFATSPSSTLVYVTPEPSFLIHEGDFVKDLAPVKANTSQHCFWDDLAWFIGSLLEPSPIPSSTDVIAYSPLAETTTVLQCLWDNIGVFMARFTLPSTSSDTNGVSPDIWLKFILSALVPPVWANSAKHLRTWLKAVTQLRTTQTGIEAPHYWHTRNTDTLISYLSTPTVFFAHQVISLIMMALFGFTLLKVIAFVAIMSGNVYRLLGLDELALELVAEVDSEDTMSQLVPSDDGVQFDQPSGNASDSLDVDGIPSSEFNITDNAQRPVFFEDDLTIAVDDPSDASSFDSPAASSLFSTGDVTSTTEESSVEFSIGRALLPEVSNDKFSSPSIVDDILQHDDLQSCINNPSDDDLEASSAAMDTCTPALIQDVAIPYQAAVGLADATCSPVISNEVSLTYTNCEVPKLGAGGTLNPPVDEATLNNNISVEHTPSGTNAAVLSVPEDKLEQETSSVVGNPSSSVPVLCPSTPTALDPHISRLPALLSYFKQEPKGSQLLPTRKAFAANKLGLVLPEKGLVLIMMQRRTSAIIREFELASSSESSSVPSNLSLPTSRKSPAEALALANALCVTRRASRPADDPFKLAPLHLRESVHDSVNIMIAKMEFMNGRSKSARKRRRKRAELAVLEVG